MRPFPLVLLASGLLLCSVTAMSRPLAGEVTRVSDGDTLWVQPAGGRPVKVRLQGIDAPEICQTGGPQARVALTGRVFGRQVDVEVQGQDRYGRAVGTLFLGDEDIGAWMVLQGHAWSYYSRRGGGSYGRHEAVARRLRRGVFTDPLPEEPREFRKNHGPCR